MPRLNIRTADQLVEHMAKVQLTRIAKLDHSAHLNTALLAIKGETPDLQLDHELRAAPTPTRIIKGVEKTAQKARFK